MRDIKSHRALYVKGGLFLGLGILSALLLLLETRTLKSGLLWALSVWAFCRAYYFAFYVIEHYVDPAYRFSGLLSFAAYLIQRKTRS